MKRDPIIGIDLTGEKPRTMSPEEARAKADPTPAFGGPVMVCCVCGDQCDAHGETQWRCIELGRGDPRFTERWYVCPRHMPPDGATAKDYARAYKRVLGLIRERAWRGERPPKPKDSGENRENPRKS